MMEKSVKVMMHGWEVWETEEEQSCLLPVGGNTGLTEVMMKVYPRLRRGALLVWVFFLNKTIAQC